MRYAKDHKQATHERIVKTAAQRFRKDGLESVGVASLMADAGLTHGGFYSHFASKDALVSEATAAALDASVAEMARRAESGGLEALVRQYLSPQHRDHPERGCAVAALGTELARQPRTSRQDFNAELRKLLELIAAHLPAQVPAAARPGRAEAVFALLVGSLQLARLTDDKAASGRILQEAAEQALKLASL